MFPPELLAKPARLRPRRNHITSAVLSALALSSAALFSVSTSTYAPPPESFPLNKTLEAPTERELVLLNANGKVFARRGGCFDTPVTRKEIPKHFIDALLATEDRHFYTHFGIDPTGVARAALSNYKAGKIVQGGSTITQQLAKISYLTSEKSYDRKIKEALAVLRLELSLTKDQILERYISRAYFGEGCFGVRAAARHYFGRQVGELTLAQSSTLVALLKSPTELSRDREALQQREKLVLRSMADDGRLNATTLAETKPSRPRAQKADAFGAYYADWIADSVQLPNDGSMTALPIRTSLEPKLQRSAEQALGNILRRSGPGRKASQAALVAMRPDGRVVAMVGGVNYKNSQFNRATQALRQPGSSFKAFVYLAAMRAGGHPNMLASDEPITIGEWSPENYNRTYRGIMPLQQAFSSSINTVAVRLGEAVGQDEVVKAARDLGISTPLTPDPSIALGTSEVTLLELTSAYAAFAANAYPVKPWGAVSFGKSGSSAGAPPRGAGQWRLMAGDSMRQFLGATVNYGTGRGARLSIPTYGKTGTSQNYRDAWFIGFAGNLVVGVWVGNDDNSPMRRVTGGNLPARIWRDFMLQAQRKDRKFRSRPQRIAAFKAKRPPSYKRMADSSRLASLLMASQSRYAFNMDGGTFFGRPMLIGQPAGNLQFLAPGYARQVRRSRTREAWDPFKNDGG